VTVVLAYAKIHAHARTDHFREDLPGLTRTHRSSFDATCYLSRPLDGAFESVLTEMSMSFHKRLGLELVQFLGV
jgi:hypothetical protein